MAKKDEKRPSRTEVVEETEKQLKQAQEGKKQVVEKYGRPKDPAKANRKKYTAHVDTDMIIKLKTEAAKRQMTAADLLDEILRAYFG